MKIVIDFKRLRVFEACFVFSLMTENLQSIITLNMVFATYLVFIRNIRKVFTSTST